MRAAQSGPLLKVRAIAGTHVVLLAWDIVPDAAPDDDLLGFAIRREELRDGQVVTRKWLQGLKRFKDIDRGVPPGTPMRSNEHPIQSFQWADYTAFAERHYRYQVVPVYGKPELLRRDYDAATTLEVSTEPTRMPVSAAAAVRHDIHFNRGVIGSQAFARDFPDVRLTAESPPASPPMKWLSRGLFEALTGFIALALDERFKLRAAFYEFHYQPVADAFARAVEAGVDVKIVYDGESDYKVTNRETLVAAGLDPNHHAIARTVSEGIRHNKFIVLFKDDVPIAVWTGSTNISAGGIFGHLNVGHVVWDAGVAAAYAAYWWRLSQNLTATRLRPLNREATPLPAGELPVGTTVLFSARDAKDDNATLDFYAGLMARATQLVCFTAAFNIDQAFQQVVSAESDVLRYIVKDDDLGDGETIGRDRDVLFAAGGRFTDGALANFLAEASNPLNRNRYIHTKVMLVDPLGDDPIVVTGSANFSRPSQRINDENMLVIRGDTRVADIYAGEFFRIFDHHYARYIVKKLQGLDRSDPNAGYLKETTKAWLPGHFDERSHKSKRRRYFAGS